MKQVGQILKESREKLGVSVQEVSMAVKINPKIIKAMEDGDLSALPQKAFLRGFVQSYARYLKLDIDQVLTVFQDEMGPVRPKTRIDDSLSSDEIEVSEKIKEATPAEILERGKWSWTVKVSILAALAVMIIIIVAVVKTIDKYESESKVIKAVETTDSGVSSKDAAGMVIGERNNEVPNFTPVSTESSDNKKHEGTTEEKSNDSVNKVQVVKEPPVVKPTPVPTVVVKPTPSKAIVKPSPSPTLVKNKKESTPEVTTSTNAVTAKPGIAPQKVNQELIIEALDTVTIEYVVDDGSTQKVTLKPDQVFPIRGNKKIKFKSSDGGVISVIHNGKDKGVPGSMGKSFEHSYQ